VAASEAVAKFWLLPLFGHSIYCPPEAAVSLCITKGEKLFCAAKLSSSTVRELPPDELVELDELDELVEPVVEELELDELLELDEDELELLLEGPPSPVQTGATKLPSWLPWKPKALLAVWPGAGSCQLCWLVNCHVVPGVLAAGVRVTFHWPTGVMVSGKVSVTVQPLNAVVPVLVTLTSTWKKLPPVLDGMAVHVYAAYAWLPSNRPDSSIANLIKAFICVPSIFMMFYCFIPIHQQALLKLCHLNHQENWCGQTKP
jgi:hypothetical protein